MPKTKKTKLPSKLVKYLDDFGIKHEILEHKIVYTAIDAANTLKREMDEIAKSLLVKADRDYYLVILPADHNLDFEKLKKFVSKLKNKEVKTIKIPGEKIVEESLKIKAGALTAFGNLHKLPVLMEKKMEKAKKAVFSSGSLNHSVEIAVKDFVKAEKAFLGNFGIKKKIKKQKITASKKVKSNTKKSGAKKVIKKKK